MSEYIHSGVAGKMNRIVKPHLGKVLVTDKYGNAKESEVDIEKLYTDLDEDNKIGNLNNLTTTNKSNLVASINELKSELGNTSSGSDWEWNPTPFYEETLQSQFNYNMDLPFTAGKQIDLTSILTNSKLTHLLLIIEKVAPSYGGTSFNKNANSLMFAFPVYNTGGAAYIITAQDITENYTNKVKHILSITPDHNFTKICYSFYGLSSYDGRNSNPNYYWNNSFGNTAYDLLIEDLILSNSYVSIASDLGVGTIIKAYTKKDN